MDKFLIAPIKSGLNTDNTNFMIPEDAFQTLRNMRVYEGKVIRREAAVFQTPITADPYGLFSRLRVDLSTTDPVTGNFAIVVPGVATATAIGQQFSVGSVLFTVYQAVGAMYVSSGAATGTFDITTGALSITGADVGTNVYWYPSYKVKEFAHYFNEGETLAFDNYFAYEYITTPTYSSWEQITGTIWTSTFNKINTENFQGAVSGDAVLFVTNNEDPIRYYDGITFVDFFPAFRSLVNYNVRKCAIVKDFNSRLLLLNTTEYEGAAVEVEHKNRVRFSTYGDCFSSNAWYQPPDITNKGSFIDLPVGKVIVCCGELNNNLIIFCEDSIYKLIPTNNASFPFQLVLVDENYGVELSNVIEHNDRLMFANHNGVFITDGNNVKEVSQNIKSLIESSELRYGRIYKNITAETIYITQNSNLNLTIPNRIINYSYTNNTWSTTEDSYTAISYVTKSPQGNDYSQKLTINGNQQGYVRRFGQVFKNDISLSISDVTRIDAATLGLFIVRHNLDTDDYIRIENSALTDLNGSYKITEIDSDNITITNTTVNAANYVGDATAAKIDQIAIQTKEFNFYMKSGFGTTINKIAFNVNKTTVNGEYKLGIGVNNGIIPTGTAASNIGSNILETKPLSLFGTYEDNAKQFWHHVYMTSSNNSTSIALVFNSTQVLDAVIPYQDLTIHAIMMYMSASAEV